MMTGFIYIMTNDAYPGYVKLGYATNVNKRLKGLNASTGVLSPFKVYAIYGVSKQVADKNLHHIIDKLNPNLRAVGTLDGKQRVKEFFAMSADDAYDLLLHIATINGCENMLVRTTPDGNNVILYDTDNHVYFEDVFLYCSKISNLEVLDNRTKNIIKTPDASVDLNDLQVVVNDTVTAFMNELMDLYPNGSCFYGFEKVPCKLLFDMFHNWYEANNKTHSTLGNTNFNKQIEDWVGNHSNEWQYDSSRARHRKLKDCDMSVFHNFPAGNNWTTYNNNDLVYSPTSDFSRNFIVYIGVKQSNEERIENLCKKVDAFADVDLIFKEYLDAEKRYDEIDVEFKQTGIANPNVPKSYPYKMSFEMWLSYNNYDVTDERDNVSRWKNMIDDYKKSKCDTL